jgi:hypothetical protein
VQTREAAAQQVAGISSSASDGEIAAFIEEHVRSITEDAQVKSTRMLITDIPNTVFLDYVDSKGSEQRMLVEVKDLVHPEWNVRARYKTINGIWNRADGTVTAEPKVVRLYEWEDALSQWVLKQEY